MNATQAIAGDDYGSFPAIAAALEAIELAGNASELSDARDALRKAELQRDIALGFTDLWGDYERDAAAKWELVP